MDSSSTKIEAQGRKIEGLGKIDSQTESRHALVEVAADAYRTLETRQQNRVCIVTSGQFIECGPLQGYDRPRDLHQSAPSESPPAVNTSASERDNDRNSEPKLRQDAKLAHNAGKPKSK